MALRAEIPSSCVLRVILCALRVDVFPFSQRGGEDTVCGKTIANATHFAAGRHHAL
jgi:hypothetical protein